MSQAFRSRNPLLTECYFWIRRRPLFVHLFSSQAFTAAIAHCLMRRPMESRKDKPDNDRSIVRSLAIGQSQTSCLGRSSSCCCSSSCFNAYYILFVKNRASATRFTPVFWGPPVTIETRKSQQPAILNYWCLLFESCIGYLLPLN